MSLGPLVRAMNVNGKLVLGKEGERVAEQYLKIKVISWSSATTAARRAKSILSSWTAGWLFSSK